ncbi:hypothetical protein GT354_40210, partial [Streptomyces sp. SID3343]|nr:hypothetical protein [Streptomyces sp. SID3343]
IGGRVGAGAPVPLRAVASTLGGRVATLNRWGGVAVVDAAYHGPGGALEAAFERLVNAGAAEPTALCAHPVPAIGDDEGGVWWYGSPPVGEGGDEPARGIVSASMHAGPVTALAAVRLDRESGTTLLVSGGRDGRIRLWSPGTEPVAGPLDERPSAVTAVAAEHTTEGPIIATAWADGLVRVRRTQDDTAVDVRLGPVVRGVGVAPDGTVVLGTAVGAVGIRLTVAAS